MKLIKTISFVFLILCFISCDKDDSLNNPQNQDANPDPTAFAQNFGNEITRTFLGTVVDTDNNPISGVSIRIGNSLAMTDSNGVFITVDATVNQRFGYVKAEKAGYIHASRAIVPSEGTNKVRIMMLAETSAGTTSSGTQETISLQNGASVSLEGDYVKPDGSAYSGTVNVIMHHLDPANENMQDQMPGMLYAANAQNEERMLQTFGMLAVELRGENGENLNLAEGSTAEITVPLNASLMANAPNSIPLWYFDEVNGYWIEDGEATLVGNTYVGTVSHFSFWNCDIPFEFINTCITINGNENIPLSNLLIAITSTNDGTAHGYTNENGEVCGQILSNEVLSLKVLMPDICGNIVIHSETIGPFNNDNSITITISDTIDLISETVTGTFTTCDGENVTDGYIQLEYGNSYFTNIITDGGFDINILRCSIEDSFSIQAIDYINSQQTSSISYTFTSPLTNLGNLMACDTFDEFIMYTIDNENHYISTSSFLGAQYPVSFDGNNDNPLLLIIPGGASNNCFVFLGFLDENNIEGTYDNFDFTVNDMGFEFNPSNAICNIDMNNTTNNITYNLTTLGEIGEFIDINFEGDFPDSQGNTHTINGIIHVIRD